VRRATKYLVLWVLLVAPTAFAVLALAATFAYEPDPALRNLIAAVWGTCLILFGIPLLVSLALWRKYHAQEVQLQTVGSILRVYDALPLTEGYATGFIDHASRTFRNTGRGVPPPAAPPIPHAPPPRPVPTAISAGATPMRYCRKCGSRVYPREGGETWQCWSCGHEQTIEG